MAVRYETGTKPQVLSSMASLAIRSEQDLIEGYKAAMKFMIPGDQEYRDAAEVIDKANAAIRDYQRFT